MQTTNNRTDSTHAEPDGSVLSYEFGLSGFSIDLKNCSVRLFNKELNNFSVYNYCNIREVNYTLPTTESDDAEICVLTDDILIPSWKFKIPLNAQTYDVCEQWIGIFNTHIFNY
ncbi:TPA_asm: hypothetical protein GB439_04315 [Salmonella enterica subsp. enterica]|uniref:Uncharacterized protein n=2 Tax=Salmonella enterica TaxID=28901 RepID=A0A5U7QQ71_SALER|nr:hypothetical protein [Salmonella enterica]ECD4938753.1 hypothetical protein [Salmonella enterica subsp. enterica]EBR5544848.1 hypothetical protein [Salmonella enterica]ECI4813942.1 hypothetical protein [Salmonella enterica subsp. enterica]EDW6016681.1 hypothetical protein [Salmonella enterica subsp. enterica]